MAIEKIGRVTVLGTLGAGANSTILRVRREADARDYALKIIPVTCEDDHKYLEQARHEFRVGQMLAHPNLVKVFAFETESDWRFRVKKAKLLVEYVPGDPLDAVPLSAPARLTRVFEKIASGVAHMHSQGVLHADLKPNNVMLGRGTSVKVIDFGLAWIKAEPKSRVQGTPEYMAPETASHKLVNERTDIYNFGATLYRTLTLHHPPGMVALAGLAMTEEVARRLYKPVLELMPGCDARLAKLIDSCLEYKARRRPASMGEVQAELDKLADEMASKYGDPDAG